MQWERVLTPEQLYSVAGTTLHATLCKAIVIHFDRILFAESRQLLVHFRALCDMYSDFVQVPREQMYSRLSKFNNLYLVSRSVCERRLL